MEQILLKIEKIVAAKSRNALKFFCLFIRSGYTNF